MKINQSIKKWGQNVEYRINSKNRSRIKKKGEGKTKKEKK